MKKLAKSLVLISLCTLLAVGTTGCTTAKAAEPKGPVRSIAVMEVQVESKPITQHYIGVVDAKDQIEYSFKSSGRLSEIYVEDGQVVKQGDPIAKLDIQDLSFQYEAAQATYSAAQLNITKALEAKDYDRNLLKSMTALYQAGSVSKDKLDQVTVKAEVSKATHDQAITQLSAAKADLNYKKALLEDTNIYAQASGSIIKTLYEAGELVPQGYPVAVQRSSVQVIKVGLPQKNLKDVTVGSTVHIQVDDQLTKGQVTRIDEAPDKATRTYMAEITVKDQKFHLGSIAEADIEVGQENGMWIPISALLSEGEDFVFVTDGQRAYKRTVTPLDTSGVLVNVEGLKTGERIVTSGMNNLSDGIQVKIEESTK